MIQIDDEVVDRSTAEAEEVPADSGADSDERSSGREEVEEWLAAVALCFGLPEGRRWIDP